MELGDIFRIINPHLPESISPQTGCFFKGANYHDKLKPGKYEMQTTGAKGWYFFLTPCNLLFFDNFEN